ncbi:hypothetical protein D9756_009423 [Leucocoprinus leucothites]|uniref:Mob1/phocein n=1 Tax=Leucocoprinus leucothites TaxID=201217 RepID=A0A8H5CW41_9AGAR|nr:hypothetical protein D9756_009423 [Leucoagaricus leucothites]
MAVEAPQLQRPLRGSRISTFYPVKSLPALSSLDSAFQLQEYISLLIRLDVHDVEAITSLPGPGSNKNAKDKESSAGDEKDEQEGKEGSASEGEKITDERDVTVDEACWIYEQLRRLAQDLTHPLITTLQQECSRTTCPEMKAGEWLYLCVAHGTEGAMEQCCAIDYILHTLDSATALLNSPRAFPSRLQIPQSSHRHFSSLARRLGRIFAHAYFHHREAFEQAEAESSLYARFLSLTSKFDLVPSEFLVIPAIPSSMGGHGGGDSDEEDGGGYDGHGREVGSGFGMGEAKLGTSYDPRRGSGGVGGAQHQLPSSFQDGFPDVPRTRRLPQQYSHYPHSSQQTHQAAPQQRSPMSLEPPPLGGTESPKKIGRNRTHTMVLSEAAGVVDELAKAAASSKAEDEEKEGKEREAKAREDAEREQREKAEAEAKAKHEEEELTQKPEEEEEEEEEEKEEEEKDEDEDVEGEEDLSAEETTEGEGGMGEAAGETSREEESTVEALLAAPEEHPPVEETKAAEEGSEAEGLPNTSDEASVEDAETTREVDIGEGASSSPTTETETPKVDEVQGDEEEDKVVEVKVEADPETAEEADLTSSEVKEQLQTDVDADENLPEEKDKEAEVKDEAEKEAS